MKDFVLLLVSFALGFCCNILSTALYPSLRLRYRRWLFSRKTVGLPWEVFNGDSVNIGGLVAPLVFLAAGQYGAGRIQCFYDGTAGSLPPDLEKLRRDLEETYTRKAEQFESEGLWYNSPTYKLKKFEKGYREIVDGEEVPVLKLRFGPTDYFTGLVTDYNIGNETRNRYAGRVNTKDTPVPEFASMFGINVNVITSDNYLVATERNHKMPVAAGKLHTSVAEGLLRPTDAGLNNAPDPFLCARRGAQEELGIVLGYDQVEFTTFILEQTYCEYGLIGWTQISETKEQVERLWSTAISKDKWENRRLIFLQCKPESVAAFLVQHRDDFHSVGMASIMMAPLQFGFPFRSVCDAYAAELHKSTAKEDENHPLTPGPRETGCYI
jgi:hypothetical protein